MYGWVRPMSTWRYPFTGPAAAWSAIVNSEARFRSNAAAPPSQNTSKPERVRQAVGDPDTRERAGRAAGEGRGERRDVFVPDRLPHRR